MFASVVVEPEIKKKKKEIKTVWHRDSHNSFEWFSLPRTQRDKQKDTRLSVPADLMSFAVFTP